MKIERINKNSRSYSLLRLGFICNAKCLFCNVPPECHQNQELSSDEAKDEIAALNKNIKLDLSGGEPTIRKDLIDIIGYASEKGINTIEIQTNALSLADKKYVKRLKRAGLNKAFVALHSHIPEIHDFLMGGLRGAFRKCLRGINNLIDSGIEVSLNPVVCSINYKTIPGYIKFIRSNFNKISYISLSVIQPRGRAWQNSFLVPAYCKISPYIKTALETAKEMHLVVYNPYCGVPFCIGGWHKFLDRCVEFCENYLRIKNKTDSYYSDNNEKIKPAQCSLCSLESFCNGVWKEYALLHSFSSLEPINLRKKIKI